MVSWIPTGSGRSIAGRRSEIARPLKRFLQRNIETKLARALIGGDITEDTEVKFTIRNDELVMNEKPAPSRENATRR